MRSGAALSFPRPYCIDTAEGARVIVTLRDLRIVRTVASHGDAAHGMTGVHLVTFATHRFTTAARKLTESARATGEFKTVSIWDEARLRGDPSFTAVSMLSHARGAGYWAWKPHIILRALDGVPDGDAVVYCDAGRYARGYTIDKSVRPLVRFAESHSGALPGVLIPHAGPAKRWTRRDCFVLMGCDEPRFWHHPQVQQTFSVWIKGSPAMDVLREWKAFCSDIRIVGDGPNTCGLPNFTDFVDHRHDQSVMTNLVVLRGLSPFAIKDRLFDFLVSRRPNSQLAHLFVKRIDNVSSIAGGSSPAILYARDISRRLVRGTVKDEPNGRE